MAINRTEGEKLVVLSIILVFIVFSFVQAESINITSGHVYFRSLRTQSDTGLWSGIKILYNSTPLSESVYPFTDIEIEAGGVGTWNFPGGNFDDGAHYYAAMIPDVFDANNILVPLNSDLDSYQLFNSVQFPDFYVPTDYDDLIDAPYDTFCCDKANVTIGGINYTAFETKLQTNMSYYLFVYNDSGIKTPLFLVPYQSHDVCYHNESCYGQFMLPRMISNPITYNFYIISKYPSYTYNIWIDGVETTTFSNTAIPYNLTIEVRHLYDNSTAPNTSILVGEDYGHNLFIPYYLSGAISQAYSVGFTNDMGRETFLVAPTPYDMTTPENYSMYISVLREGNMISPETLNVNGTDSLVRFKKSLEPTRLYDNSKASVNQMNQIVNSLFNWLNNNKFVQVRQFDFIYNVTHNTWEYYDATLGYVSEPTLKTGAPNVITLLVYDNGILQTDYTGEIKETQGYLVMNPHNDNQSLSNKDKIHYEDFEVGDQFIITPTGIEYVVEPSLTLQIYDENGGFVVEKIVDVDQSININVSGTNYVNPAVTNSLKATVNSMNSILYNLFYALN